MVLPTTKRVLQIFTCKRAVDWLIQLLCCYGCNGNTWAPCWASWKSHFVAPSCHSQASLSRSSHIWHFAALTLPLHSTRWAGDPEQCNFVSEMLLKVTLFLLYFLGKHISTLWYQEMDLGFCKRVRRSTPHWGEKSHFIHQLPESFTWSLLTSHSNASFSFAACVCFEVRPDLPGK